MWTLNLIFKRSCFYKAWDMTRQIVYYCEFIALNSKIWELYENTLSINLVTLEWDIIIYSWNFNIHQLFESKQDFTRVSFWLKTWQNASRKCKSSKCRRQLPYGAIHKKLHYFFEIFAPLFPFVINRLNLTTAFKYDVYFWHIPSVKVVFCCVFSVKLSFFPHKNTSDS